MSDNHINIGGLKKIYYILKEDVSVIPVQEEYNIIDDVTLVSGKSWKELQFTLNTGKFTEDVKNGRSGPYFEAKITAVIPKDKFSTVYSLSTLQDMEFIVWVIDNNGDGRLCGNKSKGLNFGFSRSTGNNNSAFNSNQVEFTGGFTDRQPFYLAVAPVDSGASCPTINELVAASSGSLLRTVLNEESKLDDVLSVITESEYNTNLSADQKELIVKGALPLDIAQGISAKSSPDKENTICEIDQALSAAVLKTGLQCANKLDDVFNLLSPAEIYSILSPSQITGLIPLFSAQEINDNVSTADKNKLLYIMPIKSAQSALGVSYQTGDAGDTNYPIGRLVNYKTLSINNDFGNTHRFTDLSGANAENFGSNTTIIDHALNLMIRRKLSSGAGSRCFDAVIFATACSEADSATYDGFSNWFLPTTEILSGLARLGHNNSSNNMLAWITNTAVNIWTNVNGRGVSTNTNTGRTSGTLIGETANSAATEYILVRKYK